MSLTRQQIVDEVCNVVQKDLDSVSITADVLQDRVVRFTNFAQRAIARVHDFPELNSINSTAVTVTTVKTYPLYTGSNNFGLTDIKDVHSVLLLDTENSWKLERWDYRRFDSHFPRPENYDAARPEIYTRWGDSLVFYRIPDTAYTLNIRYSRWPSDLSSAASTSEFYQKDDLLVTAAVYETYLRLNMQTHAGIWYAKLKEELGEAIRSDSNIDWEPQAEEFRSGGGYRSGTPWIDPFGSPDDPLHGYNA